DAELVHEGYFGRPILRARARDARIAQRRSAHVVRQAEGVPMDLVTREDLQVAPFVAGTKRPHVPVARGGVGLVRVVLDLEVERVVRRLVLDRVLSTLVEAGGAAALPDTEETQDAAGRHEVAGRN